MTDQPPYSGKRAVERLAESIGYPEQVPQGAVSFMLRVDGMEVLAEEQGGRLVLSMTLSTDESVLPKFASYAAGRMLREEATLAVDRQNFRVFLWQAAPLPADSRTLRRLFETFMNSCDWWRERADDLKGESRSEPDTMVIRP